MKKIENYLLRYVFNTHYSKLALRQDKNDPNNIFVLRFTDYSQQISLFSPHTTQLTFNCSKSIIETLGKGKKYVQS